MCIATSGKIIKVEGQKALVDYSSEVRPVLTGGESVKVGDYVLVQMGIVVKILSTKEAAISSRLGKRTSLPVG